MWSTPRLGPDVPLTHVQLHWPRLATRLCRMKFDHFGEGAEFRPHAYAINTHRIRIGRRVVIRPGVMLFAVDAPGGTIEIEDDVLMGSSVHMYVGNHRFDDTSKPIIEQGFTPFRPIRIERGAWVGANVVILQGVTIGQNAVVGAGSVVTKDVAPMTVAAGNPARTIRDLRDAPQPESFS